MYAGFPESFETPDAATKASYNSGTNLITAGTGTWYLLQAILANTVLSDKFNVTEQLESVYQDIEPFLKKTNDIQELAGYIQSLEEQVEDLYKEKEEAIHSFEGVYSIADLVNLAKGMEEQLKSLYSEREKSES